MAQLINTRLESFISMQNMQLEDPSQTKDFQTTKRASLNNSSEELQAVADQFEAIFLEMLLNQRTEKVLI